MFNILHSSTVSMEKKTESKHEEMVSLPEVGFFSSAFKDTETQSLLIYVYVYEQFKSVPHQHHDSTCVENVHLLLHCHVLIAASDKLLLTVNGLNGLYH